MQFRTRFFLRILVSWNEVGTALLKSSCQVRKKVKILHDLFILQNFYIHVGMQVKELTELLNIL